MLVFFESFGLIYAPTIPGSHRTKIDMWYGYSPVCPRDPGGCENNVRYRNLVMCKSESVWSLFVCVESYRVMILMNI